MDQPEPPSPPPPTLDSRLQPQAHDYILGITFLLIVVALWVSSSFLMSSMFRDESWNRPWLVTYICTSSFTLYLIRPGLSYLRNYGLSAPSIFYSPPKLVHRKSPPPSQPTRGAYTLVHNHDGNSNRSEAHTPSVTRAFSVPATTLTLRETVHLATTFVLLWFAANWSVNAALAYTSVSSTTILSSMSGFFTLAIGVVTGAERFSLGRLLAVGTSIVGVVLVSKSDQKTFHEDQPTPVPHWLLGDILALSSAALYALYVILMKVKVKDESRVDMQLFFGFVGAINLLCFWPIGILLHYTGIEPFELPRTNRLWFSVVINALCTFVSDYLYMIAMLKTSPLVVTLGISLTLPVAVIGDLVKGSTLPLGSLMGAGLVLSSFVILSFVEQIRH